MMPNKTKNPNISRAARESSKSRKRCANCKVFVSNSPDFWGGEPVCNKCLRKTLKSILQIIMKDDFKREIQNRICDEEAKKLSTKIDRDYSRSFYKTQTHIITKKSNSILIPAFCLLMVGVALLLKSIF